MTDIKQTEKNKLIAHKDIEKLANVHDQHCISIFLPTSRAGEDVDQRKGQLSLKNIIKNVKHTLKELYLSENEIDDYLQPLVELLDDNQFWRHQSDCLVIYINKERFNVYTLPIEQEEFFYISDHFYLLPLFPLVNGNKQFYILTLSMQDVKLYACTPYSISELVTDKYFPQKLEDAVGYDYEEKSLQFRSGQGSGTGAMYHGQGGGKDKKDKEIENFFRAVDSGLMELLNNEEIPLILACVDHYYPVYSNITNYPNIYEKHISGNQEETDPYTLHEMAWLLIEEYFQQKNDKIGKLMRDQKPLKKTSFDLNDIIPAAVDGRIEVLFIRNSSDRYGLYDKLNRSLIIDESSNKNQASLYNLAAVQTWLQGGRVYIAKEDKMPFQGTNINALFRY